MARMKTTSGKVTVRAQRHDGADEALIKLIHMVMPWAAWAGLTVAVNLGLFAFRHTRGFAALGAVVLGALIAVFDARQRSHRASWEGRWIGPVTAAGAALLSCLYLLAGFSQDLALAYLTLGTLACICWDIWITVGDHRDMAATFNAKAAAAGVDGAKMVEMSRRRAADPDGAGTPPARRGRGRGTGRDEVVEVGLQLPSDPAMTMDEVGDRLAHIEVATNAQPGSLALISDPDGAGYARGRSTPPDLLTRAPIGWPGPSAPGAGMSVPFRLGLAQAGEYFCYPRLPIGHLRVAGKTGSAKTMGLCWNMLAEGITREGYAAFVADPAKAEQFMGPLRPALHYLELAEDERLHLFFARLHKARLDRCNYLGRNRHTEWFPGCGLSFMECWLEEAGTVLGLLGSTQKDKADGLFMLQSWVDDVAAARSAGMAWTASFQKPIKEQTRSTVATSQMGRVCFALADKDDLRFGLSDLQRDRGCRPQLWDNPKGKAMAFFDAETLDDQAKVTPVRFWNWGPGSSRIAAYASEYQARDRPLDDVTGEAVEWTPAVSATSAFPQAGSRAGGNGTRAYENSGLSSKQASKLAAMDKLRKRIISWRDHGREDFQLKHLEPHYAEIGKDRTWYYSALPTLVSEGLLAELPDCNVRTWQILAASTSLHAVDDLPGDEEQDEGDVPA